MNDSVCCVIIYRQLSWGCQHLYAGACLDAGAVRQIGEAQAPALPWEPGAEVEAEGADEESSSMASDSIEGEAGSQGAAPSFEMNMTDAQKGVAGKHISSTTPMPELLRLMLTSYYDPACKPYQLIPSHGCLIHLSMLPM